MVNSKEVSKIKSNNIIKEKIMDALPLSINKEQLELLYQSIEQSMNQLQEPNQGFSAKDRSQQEENLLTYGTDDFTEAQERINAIKEQVKSQLDAWDRSPDEVKPVPLDLDPYQLKVLHKGIQQQMNTLDAPKKELLSDVITQLPESSMQEDSD